ncbi:MAG: ACR3 family arsenite efflux transporter [Candidatus Cryosericum sp.]
MKEHKAGLGVFQKYLSVWVALCMIGGVILGRLLPGVVGALDRMTVYNISLPVAVLIWLMIYPMMLQIDFGSIKRVGRNPTGLVITLIVNWAIKPFTMFALASLFFRVFYQQILTPDQVQQYVAGAVLLGAAPCTAMVFVWSYLSGGDPAHTLVQVAINDLVILVLFIPIVALLLGVGGISVPYPTLFLSVILFVVIPLAGGALTRRTLIRSHGQEWYDQVFLPRWQPVTVVALLATLLLIFSFQGETITANWVNILLIAVPLILQTYLIFWIAYGACKLFKVPYRISAPAAMIGASNFFELAVAVAISLWGINSGAALATTVGVLTEVPVMLTLVSIARRTRHWFPDARTTDDVRAGVPLSPETVTLR